MSGHAATTLEPSTPGWLSYQNGDPRALDNLVWEDVRTDGWSMGVLSVTEQMMEKIDALDKLVAKAKQSGADKETLQSILRLHHTELLALDAQMCKLLDGPKAGTLAGGGVVPRSATEPPSIFGDRFDLRPKSAPSTQPAVFDFSESATQPTQAPTLPPAAAKLLASKTTNLSINSAAVPLRKPIPVLSSQPEAIVKALVKVRQNFLDRTRDADLQLKTGVDQNGELTIKQAAAVVRAWNMAKQPKEEGEEWVEGLLMLTFFDSFFTRRPDIKTLFTDLTVQSEFYAGLVDLIVPNVANDLRSRTLRLVEQGQQHAFLGITKDMYEAACEALTDVAKDRLGDRFDLRTREAWFASCRLVTTSLLAAQNFFSKPKARKPGGLSNAVAKFRKFGQKDAHTLPHLHPDQIAMARKKGEAVAPELTIKQAAIIARAWREATEPKKAAGGENREIPLAVMSEMFFEDFFARCPEARPIFGNNFRMQTEFFSCMAVHIVPSARDLSYRRDIVEMGEQHARLGLTREMYKSACEALTHVMKKRLGNKFDTKLRDAWLTSCNLVCESMLAAQRLSRTTRDSQKRRQGGLVVPGAPPKGLSLTGKSNSDGNLPDSAMLSPGGSPDGRRKADSGLHSKGGSSGAARGSEHNPPPAEMARQLAKVASRGDHLTKMLPRASSTVAPVPDTSTPQPHEISVAVTAAASSPPRVNASPAPVETLVEKPPSKPAAALIVATFLEPIPLLVRTPESLAALNNKQGQALVKAWKRTMKTPEGTQRPVEEIAAAFYGSLYDTWPPARDLLDDSTLQRRFFISLVSNLIPGQPPRNIVECSDDPDMTRRLYVYGCDVLGRLLETLGKKFSDGTHAAWQMVTDALLAFLGAERFAEEVRNPPAANQMQAAPQTEIVVNEPSKPISIEVEPSTATGVPENGPDWPGPEAEEGELIACGWGMSTEGYPLEDFMARFYEELFVLCPDCEAVFYPPEEKQDAATEFFVGLVSQTVPGHEQFDLFEIGLCHGVASYMYEHACIALINVVAGRLGPMFTDPMREAWENSCRRLCHGMMQQEWDLRPPSPHGSQYDEGASGFAGPRAFGEHEAALCLRAWDLANTVRGGEDYVQGEIVNIFWYAFFDRIPEARPYFAAVESRRKFFTEMVLHVFPGQVEGGPTARGPVPPDATRDMYQAGCEALTTVLEERLQDTLDDDTVAAWAANLDDMMRYIEDQGNMQQY